MTRPGSACFALPLCVLVLGATLLAQGAVTRVRVETSMGVIVLEVDGVRAPSTATNFLRYVDAGHYDGGSFHRTVTMKNQPDSHVKIEVIQAGVAPDKAKQGFGPIALDRTSVTGLKHRDGTISMARNTPDSASSGWFICVNDQPELDFGGKRNPDGQGFAAFGRVVEGMDVARRIHAASNERAQNLTPPIQIVRMARLK